MRARTFGTALLVAAFVLGTAAPATAAPTGTIAGKLWFDRDGDGRMNGTEQPASSRWVRLLDRFGNRIAETQADRHGVYIFRYVAPGDYQVDGAQPGYGYSTPTTRGVTTAADVLTIIDFGVRGGTITGRSWFDAYANGIREPDEPGLVGSVGLRSYGGLSTSNVDGEYTIEEVPIGEATVVAYEVRVLDWLYPRTLPHQGADTTLDSDFDQVTGVGPTFTFELQPDGSVRSTTPATADVGFYQGNVNGTLTITPDRDTTDLHVGDTVTFTGTATYTGNTSDTHGVASSYYTPLPPGMRLTSVDPGPDWRTDYFTNDVFYISDGFERHPSEFSTTFTVQAVITAPTTGRFEASLQRSSFLEESPTNHVSIPINAT